MNIEANLLIMESAAKQQPTNGPCMSCCFLHAITLPQHSRGHPELVQAVFLTMAGLYWEAPKLWALYSKYHTVGLPPLNYACSCDPIIIPRICALCP